MTWDVEAQPWSLIAPRPRTASIEGASRPNERETCWVKLAGRRHENGDEFGNRNISRSPMFEAADRRLFWIQDPTFWILKPAFRQKPEDSHAWYHLNFERGFRIGPFFVFLHFNNESNHPYILNTSHSDDYPDYRSKITRVRLNCWLFSVIGRHRDQTMVYNRGWRMIERGGESTVIDLRNSVSIVLIVFEWLTNTWLTLQYIYEYYATKA